MTAAEVQRIIIEFLDDSAERPGEGAPYVADTDTPASVLIDGRIDVAALAERIAAADADSGLLSRSEPQSSKPEAVP